MKGSMSSRVLFLSMLTEGMCISCFHWMVYIKIEFYSNIFNIDFETFKNVAQKGINQRRIKYTIPIDCIEFILLHFLSNPSI